MEPLKILFEDDTMLVVEKPAGIDVTELQKLLPKEAFLAHRLDKETSGVLLAAKTQEALHFFRTQFKERKVEKKYTCLVVGNIANSKGRIETLQGRAGGDRRKQRVFLQGEPGQGEKREAVSEYRVLERYQEGYTLLEVLPKTGRKHQIRSQFAFLNHPLAGDKLYGFKNQPVPQLLQRHFLHASYLRIPRADGTTQEIVSELPKDLQNVLTKLHHANQS